MWSISINDQIALEHNAQDGVGGPGANMFFGTMMFEDEIQLSPVGPTVKWPPKNEIEWFAVAYDFASRLVKDAGSISSQPPPGFEKWMRPGGPNAVY